MRKSHWLCLTVILGSVSWLDESSACWWQRHRGYRNAPALYSPQPVYYTPFAYVPRAPVAQPGTASPQPRHAAGAPQAPMKTFVFQGKTYQAVQTTQHGKSEESELRDLAPSAAPRRASDGEHFAGSARKSAKTSFANGSEESFASPGALLDSILQGTDPDANDQSMRGKLHASSPRDVRGTA